MVQSLPSEAFFDNRSFSEGCSGGGVQGSWFKVHGSRFRVQGSRFKVQGLKIPNTDY